MDLYKWMDGHADKDRQRQTERQTDNNTDTERKTNRTNKQRCLDDKPAGKQAETDRLMGC